MSNTAILQRARSEQRGLLEQESHIRQERSLSKIKINEKIEKKNSGFWEGVKSLSQLQTRRPLRRIPVRYLDNPKKKKPKRHGDEDVEDSKKESALASKDGTTKSTTKQKKGLIAKIRQWLPEPILHPHGNFKTRWDLFLYILVIYSILSLPIEIGFAPRLSSIQIGIDIAIDILFFIDVLFSFNTAYPDPNFSLAHEENQSLTIAPYSEGFIWDRTLIAQHYVKGWFITDFLSAIPFDRIITAAYDGSPFDRQRQSI